MPSIVDQRRILRAVMDLSSPKTRKIVEEESPELQNKHNRTERTREEPRRQLNYDHSIEEFCTPFDFAIKTKTEELNIKKDELFSKQQILKLLEDEIPVVRKECGKLCGKCHLYARHTKAKCPDKECSDARICGQLDRHPQQRKEIQKISAAVNVLEKETKELCADIEQKQKLAENLQCSFEAKIRKDLINSDQGRYTFHASDGTKKVRTALVKADTAILKIVLKGEVPGTLNPSTITGLIKNFNAKNERLDNSDPIHVKKLKEKGIVWPSSSKQSREEVDSSPPAKLRKIPDSPLQPTNMSEEELVRRAIAESLRPAYSSMIPTSSTPLYMPSSSPYMSPGYLSTTPGYLSPTPGYMSSTPSYMSTSGYRLSTSTQPVPQHHSLYGRQAWPTQHRDHLPAALGAPPAPPTIATTSTTSTTTTYTTPTITRPWD